MADKMAWPTFLTPHAEPVTYQWIRWLWISSCLSISTVDILVIIWFVTKSSLKSIPPFSPEFLFLTVCGRWPKILHCPLTPRILIWRRSSFFVVLFYFVLFFIIIISWLSKKRDCHLYSTPFRFIQSVLASAFEPSWVSRRKELLCMCAPSQARWSRAAFRFMASQRCFCSCLWGQGQPTCWTIKLKDRFL